MMKGQILENKPDKSLYKILLLGIAQDKLI